MRAKSNDRTFNVDECAGAAARTQQPRYGLGMAPLVFESARGKLVLHLATSVGFVLAGVLILLSGRAGGGIIGAMSILFFGGCALVLGRQLFDARPRLVIDDAGVLDRTLKVGVIAWEDILDAH